MTDREELIEKYRHGNRLYTRVQARELGRIIFQEDDKALLVVPHNAAPAFWMHLFRAKWGQKYVEEDEHLRKRDRFLRKMKDE